MNFSLNTRVSVWYTFDYPTNVSVVTGRLWSSGIWCLDPLRFVGGTLKLCLPFLYFFQKFVIPKTEKRKMVEDPIPMDYSASVEAMVII